MSSALRTAPPGSPWARPHLRTTVGVFSLAFLFAFEALAVATVMPEVARDLDGLPLYALAFAAPMAASVVALSVAGEWVDRHGTARALVVGVLVFCVGVVLAGLAPSMEVFLAGRLVHGLGGGVMGVALYVVVAESYPAGLRPRVFAVMTAAWVLPALVGPLLAGVIADLAGWRWVFLAVPAVALASWWLVRSAAAAPGESSVAVDRRRLGWAVLAATGVSALAVGGQRQLDGWLLLVVAGAGAALLAAGRLLPPGTWRARPGLPAVLVARGLVGASFAGAEAYLPLLLTTERGLSLSQAGLVLTAAAVAWCLGAQAAARVPSLSDELLRVRLGTSLVAVAVATTATVGVAGVPLVLPVAAWAVAGFGIGMAFSTLAVLALATADDGEAGRVSSSLQLNDALVQAFAMALGAVVFAAFVGSSPATGATLLVLASGAVAAAAVPLRLR
ncbi:MFS transporter [Aeromicrobium choanae]|uniref:Predicted arabinose efflux permease, MFS family n=1 Tax=Aeromicrobium choanae TaxID=1736691 RepID=A0A1T4Z6C5_9ACTN|nr:MFS transporter [Aeromicrobium choanae]SKB09131.1 Predicted arabinose efflux permease, MFS family [Aeromicrobium choanae]